MKILKTIDSVVLLGGGGHGKVILSIVNKIPSYHVIGYTDPVNRGSVLGAKWLGEDRQIETIAAGRKIVGILGIGFVQMGDVDKRRGLVGYLHSVNVDMPTIVSPTAIINEGVYPGEGLVAMDGVVVNTGTTLGEAVILNTRCSVDHDCRIGGFTHIAPGAIICGNVAIGSGCLIGAGAVICPGRRIGDRCIIGAGAVVTRDCSESGTYVGIPARRMA